jgi:hypothetical protein
VTDFFRAGDSLLRVDDVREVDVRHLADCRVAVRMEDGRVFDLAGPDAVELVLLTKPSALEGRRLRWVRHAWAVHNLVGHPGMQVLAWLGRTKLGLRLHDATTPRPRVQDPAPGA